MSGLKKSTVCRAAVWICTCWVSVLFLGFSFFPGFFESILPVCCLFPWLAQVVCSEGMAADIGSWDTGMSWGKESWKRSLYPLVMGLGRKKETTEDFLVQSLGWNWVSRASLLGLGSKTKQGVCGRKLEGGGSMGFIEIRGGNGREDCQRCSDAELGMRLMDWIWGNRERGECLCAAYLVS